MRTSALFLIAAVLATPAATTELPGTFEDARTSYYQAIEGDQPAYRTALTLFSRLYSENSAIPIIQVYYGSLRLLEASRT